MGKAEEEIRNLRRRLPGLRLVGFFEREGPVTFEEVERDKRTLEDLRLALERAASAMKAWGGGELREFYLRGAYGEVVALKVRGKMCFAVVQSPLPIALVLTEVKRFFSALSLPRRVKTSRKPQIDEQEVLDFLQKMTTSQKEGK